MKIKQNKLYLLAIIFTLLYSSCNNSSNAKDTGNDKTNSNTGSAVEAKKTDSAKGTKMLTREDFLKKVMNYEKNPQTWKYLGDKPAIIDFYADWCGPCRMAAPVLEELAVEYADQIHIYKIDTEKERQLASDFGIQSIPAFLFVPMEGQPTMTSGIARTQEETKEMFKKMINELLLTSNQ